MPRIGEPTAKQVEAAFVDFQSGFKRSRRGNLWQQYQDWIVTVFRCADGNFAWCISAGEDDVEFSSENFATEQQAMDSVGVQLLKLNFGMKLTKGELYEQALD